MYDWQKYDFQVGQYAYTEIQHLDIIGNPNTEIHGIIQGFDGDKLLLSVEDYGIFSIHPAYLKKEKSNA